LFRKLKIGGMQVRPIATKKATDVPCRRNMVKFKLEHDRQNCIGCGACAAVAPEHWEMGPDGKSDIIECTKRQDGWQEKQIESGEYEKNRLAADSCPVNVIHIKRENGEKII